MIKVLLAKLIFVIFAAGLIAAFIKKKKGRNLLIPISVMAFIFGITSNLLVASLPQKVEQIEITVSDEKNKNAAASDIVLKKIVADGKESVIPNAREGKWIWLGDSYVYKSDSDNLVTGELTKRIILEIPIGSSRELIFSKAPNMGIVHIKTSVKEITQDLYSENETEIGVKIGGSPLGELRFYKIQILLIFALIFSAFMCIFTVAFLQAGKRKKGLQEWFGKNWDYYIYAFIGIYTLIGLMCTVKGDSLWYDELWNIGWYKTGDPIYNQYSHHFLMRFWYHLMPYGEQYLLFLTELISAFAVFLTGVAGRMYGGKRVGIFASAVIASVPYFYEQVGAEFRNYYLLYFATVVLFITYMRRGNGETVSLGRIAAYSLCAALTMDSHPYGILVAAVFLGIDFLLMIFRRIPWKNIVSFVFPAIYFVIWIFTNDMGSTWNNYSWTAVPNAAIVYKTVFLLCGESGWMLGMLILGFICIAADCYFVSVKCNRRMEESIYKIMPILATGGVFFASIIYSVWINPDNSLYVERYFISVLLFVVILIAAGFDWIWNGLGNCIAEAQKKQIGRLTAAVLIAMILNGSMQYFLNPTVHEETNYEAAQWLISQEDIYNNDTLVAVTGNKYVVEGLEYYITQKGKKDLPNIYWASYGVPEEMQKYSKIYTLTMLGREVSDGLGTELEQEFVKAKETAPYGIRVYERK